MVVADPLQNHLLGPILQMVLEMEDLLQQLAKAWRAWGDAILLDTCVDERHCPVVIRKRRNDRLAEARNEGESFLLRVRNDVASRLASGLALDDAYIDPLFDAWRVFQRTFNRLTNQGISRMYTAPIDLSFDTRWSGLVDTALMLLTERQFDWDQVRILVQAVHMFYGLMAYLKEDVKLRHALGIVGQYDDTCYFVACLSRYLVLDFFALGWDDCKWNSSYTAESVGVHLVAPFYDHFDELTRKNFSVDATSFYGWMYDFTGLVDGTVREIVGRHGNTFCKLTRSKKIGLFPTIFSCPFLVAKGPTLPGAREASITWADDSMSDALKDARHANLCKRLIGLVERYALYVWTLHAYSPTFYYSGMDGGAAIDCLVGTAVVMAIAIVQKPPHADWDGVVGKCVARWRGDVMSMMRQAAMLYAVHSETMRDLGAFDRMRKFLVRDYFKNDRPGVLPDINGRAMECMHALVSRVLPRAECQDAGSHPASAAS